MSKLRPSMMILVSAMALATGAVVLTTHAADQGNPQAGAQSASAAAAQPTRTAAAAQPARAAAATPALPNAVTPSSAKAVAKPPTPGAPQVPEESATIRDDPTVVPDPKQSADNNVSFPNDI